MRRTLIALALAAFPGLAAAQGWATREVCTVDAPALDPTVFDPPGLAALEAVARTLPNGTGRLWRITAANGAVSHLWGTFHSSDRLVIDLPDAVRDLVSQARVVALETDFVAPTRAAYDAQVQREAWYLVDPEPFDTGSTGLPAQVIENIRARTAGLGWGRDAPDYLTLGGIGELILSDPCEDFSAGIIPNQDDLIQTLGVIAGARIVALEPADAFLDFMNDPRNRDTALSILTVYGAYLHQNTSNRARAASFALYLEGRTGLSRAWDGADLARLLGPGAAALHLTRADAYLLDQRNLTFLGSARPHLDDGGVFIAIGSFHLSGDRGMVALLRAEGYDVARIPLPGESP